MSPVATTRRSEWARKIVLAEFAVILSLTVLRKFAPADVKTDYVMLWLVAMLFFLFAMMASSVVLSRLMQDAQDFRHCAAFLPICRHCNQPIPHDLLLVFMWNCLHCGENPRRKTPKSETPAKRPVMDDKQPFLDRDF